MADTHARRQNTLTLLGAEHRAIEKRLDAFKHATDHDLERNATLVQRAGELLCKHAVVEEEILYAARAALRKPDEIDQNEAHAELFLPNHRSKDSRR